MGSRAADSIVVLARATWVRLSQVRVGTGLAIRFLGRISGGGGAPRPGPCACSTAAMGTMSRNGRSFMRHPAYARCSLPGRNGPRQPLPYGRGSVRIAFDCEC